MSCGSCNKRNMQRNEWIWGMWPGKSVEEIMPTRVGGTNRLSHDQSDGGKVKAKSEMGSGGLVSPDHSVGGQERQGWHNQSEQMDLPLVTLVSFIPVHPMGCCASPPGWFWPLQVRHDQSSSDHPFQHGSCPPATHLKTAVSSSFPLYQLKDLTHTFFF